VTARLCAVNVRKIDTTVILAIVHPIPNLDKPNVSFTNILSTLVWFCPLFWHCVHIFRYMSTFWNIYPPLGIYVHISEYMSTFPCKCPHFRKYVQLMKYMPFFLINIQCLCFGTNLCFAQVTNETLQIRRPVTKKHRERTRQDELTINLWRARLCALDARN